MIAQEVSLARPDLVSCAALLATYGRQNEIDTVLQECWDMLASAPEPRLDPVRLALSLLTAYPARQLADDSFVARARSRHLAEAGERDSECRRRAATFIAGYQARLDSLTGITRPCLVMGFELDTDTFAERAREVAHAIPTASYAEVPGAGHAAPLTHAGEVWPHVTEFITSHHPHR